jgi:SAM-dependent methyltransferase
LKVVAQHALAYLPGAGRLEELLRRRVTRTTALSAEIFRFRVRWSAGPYLRAMASHFGALDEIDHEDVGAGWHPIVPFVLCAAGVRRQRLMDVEPHLFVPACRETARVLAGELDWLRSEVPACAFSPVSLAAGEISLAALLAPLGIRYAAPERSTALARPDASVDVATVSGVLPYLRPAALDGLMRELDRVLKPNGLLGVYVNLIDDFSGFDRSLSSFHFLRYSDATWERLVCSPRYYNNRWRMRRYLELFATHGFEPVLTETEPPTAEDLRALATMPIAERFRGEPLAELGVRRFLTVLRRTNP